MWEMRRRAGPVQQWIDSIPLPVKSDITIANEYQECIPNKTLMPTTEPKDIPLSKESKFPRMTVSAPINVPNSPAMSTPILPSSLPHQRLARDASFQSDSSHCSSVESLLELRRADPAAILFDLGFGGCSASPQEDGPLSRIPKRFLQPSTLRGIAIDDFVRQQQETSESFDSVSLGYRGLTGSPYVAPSEIVQKIMERLREHESHDTDTNCEQYNLLHQNGKLSVLSPDNRQFLEQTRSKSPDMHNKRMIIGQKSFVFGCDGNLIEILSSEKKLASSDTINDHNAALSTEEFVESEQSSLKESITFDQQYLSKDDEKLAKQLSFDDTIEFLENEQLIKDDRAILPNIVHSDTNVNKSEQERNTSEDVFTTNGKYEMSQHCSDIRRASDGSCNTKSVEDKIFNEGRRFSDGVVHVVESQRNDRTLLQKRKSFKRQSRVCDTTAMNYGLTPIKSNVPDAISEYSVDNEEVSDDTTNISIHQLNAPKLCLSIESKNLEESKTDTEFLSGKTNQSLQSKISESIEQIGHSKITEDSSDNSYTEDNQICCYKSKACKSCKHIRKSDYCCHVDKRKYLKKMERIMQENKKLKNMLAKNKREMAEIRDMLHSISSVRMEPGF